MGRTFRIRNPLAAVGSTTPSPSVSALRCHVDELENHLVVAEQKGQIVLDWADTMYRDHRSLQKQVWFNTSRHHANEVIVGGIAELPQQDYKKAASTFFKEKLKVEAADGDIKFAKCIGKEGRTLQKKVENDGQRHVIQIHCPRHMVVTCLPAFKAKLMSNKKKLSGLVDPQGYKYFVSHYLPEPFKAAKNKHQEEVSRIIKGNAGKPLKEQTKVRVVGTDLYVNNKARDPIIKPPTPAEVWQLHQDFHPELQSFEMVRTWPVFEDLNTFEGYSAQVNTLLAVNLCYSKVRQLAPRARHIMCAYRVSGMEDLCDDGEDHAGLMMLKLMKKENINNTVVFVSRIPGPDQLGAKCFDIIRRLVFELFQMMADSADKTPVDVCWQKTDWLHTSCPQGPATTVSATAEVTTPEATPEIPDLSTDRRDDWADSDWNQTELKQVLLMEE